MCEREFTAREITELLRRCSKDDSCVGCEMYVLTGCENKLKGYAADMIEKQVNELAKLKADYTFVINHRDELAEKLACITAHRDAIAEEQKILHERCQVQQNEINALVLKLGKQEDKPDQPTSWHENVAKAVEAIQRASYQEGRADALETFINRYFFEEVQPNE